MSGKGFVLFSMPRTGSSMVVSILASHPDIVCLPAIFAERGWSDWAERAKKAQTDKVAQRMATLPEKWNDIECRTEEIGNFTAAMTGLFPEAKAVGFKQHLGSIGRETTARIVGLNWPAIVLTRKNALASYSSGKIVELTGQGSLTVRQEPRRAKAKFVALDFDNYARWLDAAYAYWQEEIAASGVPYMAIDYCEARNREGMERIVDFLGLRLEMLGEGRTAKRNSDDILNRFSNPEDAAAFLRERDLMHWATEA